jgi:hypothetical protein
MSETPRLFDPDRYPPTSVGVMLHLEPSNARAFMVAQALGNWLRLDGSRERIRGGGDAIGAEITRGRRTAILAALQIELRQWQRYVVDWQARSIAHPCKRGVVFLFARQVPALECPACHAEMPVISRPSFRGRGDGFTDGTRRTTTPNASHYDALTRTTTTRGRALVRRVSEPDRAAKGDASLQRDKKGVGPSEVKVSEVEEDPSEAVLEIPPRSQVERFAPNPADDDIASEASSAEILEMVREHLDPAAELLPMKRGTP